MSADDNLVGRGIPQKSQREKEIRIVKKITLFLFLSIER